MSRLLSVALVVLAAAGLGACTPQASPSSAQPESSQSAALSNSSASRAPAKNASTYGHAFQFSDGLSVSVAAPAVLTGVDRRALTTDTGQRLSDTRATPYAFHVTVDNGSADPVNLARAYTVVYTSDAVASALSGPGAPNPDMGTMGTVHAGAHRSFSLAFAVPDDTPVTFEFNFGDSVHGPVVFTTQASAASGR